MEPKKISMRIERTWVWHEASSTDPDFKEYFVSILTNAKRLEECLRFNDSFEAAKK